MSGENQIQVGDTVKLKSGRPAMTVAAFYRNRGESMPAKVRCQWFGDPDASHPSALRTEIFPIKSLDRV